jgi:hypothetical protein
MIVAGAAGPSRQLCWYQHDTNDASRPVGSRDKLSRGCMNKSIVPLHYRQESTLQVVVSQSVLSAACEVRYGGPSNDGVCSGPTRGVKPLGIRTRRGAYAAQPRASIMR